jgi:hypothetical protein
MAFADLATMPVGRPNTGMIPVFTTAEAAALAHTGVDATVKTVSEVATSMAARGIRKRFQAVSARHGIFHTTGSLHADAAA